MPSVKDLMTRQVLVTSPHRTAVDAARTMMSEGTGSVVVVEDERPVAIVTERDLLRKVVAEGLDPSTVKVSDIISAPLITVGPDEPLRNAARLMLDRKIRRLPVVKAASWLE